MIDIACGKPDLKYEAVLNQRHLSMRQLQSDFQTFKTDVDKNATYVLYSWLALMRVFDEHKGLIKTKWRKMSKTKRQEFLKKNTSMPAMHWPDFKTSRIRPQTTEHQQAYVAPSLNYEDLCEGDTLLLFLSSRVRYRPEMFAHKDLYESRLGLALGYIILPDVEGYTMILDELSPGEYGRLLSWDNTGRAQALLKSGQGFQPGKGRIILGKQCLILNTLLMCCLKLSPNPSMTEEQVISDMQTWFGSNLGPRAGPRNGIAVSTGAGNAMLAFDEDRDDATVEKYLETPKDLPSLDTVVREAPYRVPTNINFAALHALAEARFATLEDHVQCSREDPACFLETLSELVNHSLIDIPDAQGKVHERCRDHRIWDDAIGRTVASSYPSFLYWEHVSQYLQKLITLQRKHAHILNPRSHLPQDYLIEILTLRRTLFELSTFYRSLLNDIWPASPSLRALFIRCEIPTSYSQKGVPVTLKEGVDTSAKDCLINLLSELSVDRMISHVGLPLLIDELEHLLKDPNQKIMVSAQVQPVLSDLGLVAHLLNEIESYHPWAATMKKDSETHMEELSSRWDDFEQNLEALDPVNKLLVGEHIMPPQQKIYYPSEIRTKERVETMQRAERKLRSTWSVIDAHFQRHSGKTWWTCFTVASRSSTSLSKLQTGSMTLAQQPPKHN